MDVVIAGGGPVGMTLAVELGLAGLDVLVLEKLTPEQRREADGPMGMRAMNVPTIEHFGRRGLLPALRKAQERAVNPWAGDGESVTIGHFSLLFIKSSMLDPDDPDVWRVGKAVNGGGFVYRADLVELLADRARELGVQIRHGAEVTDFESDADGVTIHVGTERIRAGWLVGCDGAHSRVRRVAGIDFPGVDPEQVSMQALVELEGDLPASEFTDAGFYVNGPIGDGVNLVGPTEFVTGAVERDVPVTAELVQETLRRISGRPVTIKRLHYGSRSTDATRQAATYRKGRVLLAGDAAHVHPPYGGQGMNLGIGDAANLGWKLAATIRGTAPPGLLDTYHEERHPVGKWVQDWAMAQVALLRPDPRSKALRAVMRDLLDTVDGATYVVKNISGVARAANTEESSHLADH